MFRERDSNEPIHWSQGHDPKFKPSRKISDITPGSTVGLQTDEGDLVQINVTRNDAGDFAVTFVGSIVNIHPDPPRSKGITGLQVGDEVSFGETSLLFVFSVPK